MAKELHQVRDPIIRGGHFVGMVFGVQSLCTVPMVDLKGATDWDTLFQRETSDEQASNSVGKHTVRITMIANAPLKA